jgi:predicted HicB family RNase H-like nuclease
MTPSGRHRRTLGAILIERAFRDSVDDYLDFCAKRGEEPDRPFSGRLMVRLSPGLLREHYRRAKREGKSLNQLIQERLSEVG